MKKSPLSSPLIIVLGIAFLGAVGLTGYTVVQQRLGVKPGAEMEKSVAQEGSSDAEGQRMPDYYKTEVDLVADRPAYKNWGVFELPSVGVRFQLPERVHALGEFTEQIVPGEMGYQLCGQFERGFSLIPQAFAGGGCGTQPNPYLSIGTTSVDYVAGREMGPLDLQGYVSQGGQYQAKTVDHRLFDLPKDEVRTYTNAHGIELLIVDSKDIHRDEGPTIMSGFADRWGVIVNTKSTIYPGMVFLLSNSGGLTAAEFELFLDSIEVF